MTGSSWTRPPPKPTPTPRHLKTSSPCGSRAAAASYRWSYSSLGDPHLASRGAPVASRPDARCRLKRGPEGPIRGATLAPRVTGSHAREVLRDGGRSEAGRDRGPRRRGEGRGSVPHPRHGVAHVHGAVAGGDGDGVGASGQRDVRPLEDLVGARDRAADRGAVHGEARRGGAGVRLHRHGRGGAGVEAARGDVDEGRGRPVRLVPEEGVLLCLAIVGDQALVVATGGVTLVAAVDGEVEHVPDDLRPQVAAGLHLLP